MIKSSHDGRRIISKGFHQHAIARWMLGTIQGDIENNNAEALINWNGAINEFVLLEEVAGQKVTEEKNIYEKKKWEEKKDWYFGRITEMKANLQEKINEKFS